MKDALALGGDEGRDKLRKAAVRGKCPSTRGCPNGETRAARAVHGLHEQVGRTRGTETSQYPQEEKIRMIAPVVASERARAQTAGVATHRAGL